MALLSEAFPKLEFNPGLYWACLCDMSDEAFELGIIRMIKFQSEIYPTSNPIALIRKNSDDAILDRFKIANEERLKLERETESERIERWKREAVPMPEECRKELQKLKENMGADGLEAKA